MYDKPEHNKWARYFEITILISYFVYKIVASKVKQRNCHTQFVKYMNIKLNYIDDYRIQKKEEEKNRSKAQVWMEKYDLSLQSSKTYWSLIRNVTTTFAMTHASNLYLLIAR